MIDMYSLFCCDIDAQMNFYRNVFGWTEHVEGRSPIFRGLHAENILIGFHAPEARSLLGIELTEARGLAGFITVQVSELEDVSALAAKAETLGGQIVKAAFATYYRQWQALLRDPEGNLLRLAHHGLPAGLDIPRLDIGGL